MLDKYLIGKKKESKQEWNIVMADRHIYISANTDKEAMHYALSNNMIKEEEINKIAGIQLIAAPYYEVEDKEEYFNYRATFDSEKKAEKAMKSLEKKGYIIKHFTKFTGENQEPWWEVEAVAPVSDDNKIKNEHTMAEKLKAAKSMTKEEIDERIKESRTRIKEIEEELKKLDRQGAALEPDDKNLRRIEDYIDDYKIELSKLKQQKRKLKADEETVQETVQETPIGEVTETPVEEIVPVVELPLEEPKVEPKEESKVSYEVKVTKWEESEAGESVQTQTVVNTENLTETLLSDMLKKVEAGEIKEEEVDTYVDNYYDLYANVPNDIANWDIEENEGKYKVSAKDKEVSLIMSKEEMDKLFIAGWNKVADKLEIVSEIVESDETKIQRLNEIDKVMQEQTKLIDAYYNPEDGDDKQAIMAKITELSAKIEAFKVIADPNVLINPDNKTNDQQVAEKPEEANKVVEPEVKPEEGQTVAPKKDSFDITEGVSLGDGFIAHKDTEKNEIYVLDKQGTEVMRVHNGFKDDIEEIIKTFRSLLNIKEEPAQTEVAAPESGASTVEEVKPETTEEKIDQISEKIDEIYDLQVGKKEENDEEKAEEETQNVAELAELKKEIDQKRTEVNKTLKSLMDNNQIAINSKDIQAMIIAGEDPIFARKKAMQAKLRRFAKKLYAMDMATIKTIQDVLIGKKKKNNETFMLWTD